MDKETGISREEREDILTWCDVVDRQYSEDDQRVKAFALRQEARKYRAYETSLSAAEERIRELKDALGGIKWKSADRDNMEFQARITYAQMDAIRAALKGVSE